MSNTTCTTVQASSDILGVGIRVNFYYTMLLLATIPRTPGTEELLNSLYQNAGIAGFGLLLTAIIQNATNQLSLFEALFILHILFFLGTGASPMGKYDWTKGRLVMGILVQFVSVITFTAWGLYVWADVDRFGSESDRICNNHIKYVIFFVSVRATAPWLRGIWIAAIVLSAVGLMLSFVWNAMKLFDMRSMAKEPQEETDTIAHREVILMPGTQPHGATKTAEKRWYFDISFTLLFSAIYSTVMLELMVRRNNANVKNGPGSVQTIEGPGVVSFDNSWQFGQVLAVVMLLANVNDFLHVILGFLARRKQRLDRKRQVQTEEIALQVQREEHPAPTFYRPRGPSGPNLSTRDESADKISTVYEQRNLDKRNAEVSETVTVSNLEAQDRPIGTLR